MKTTVRLDDSLLTRARDEAARRGVTLTSLIEEGLHLVLATSAPHRNRTRVSLPVCNAGGGTLPGVRLDDTSALLDRMGGRS